MMVREDDILLILFNNPCFSPSKNGETKALTNEQREEYISKLPINESKNTRPIIYGNLKEELASGKLVDAFEVIEGL